MGSRPGLIKSLFFKTDVEHIFIKIDHQAKRNYDFSY